MKEKIKAKNEREMRAKIEEKNEAENEVGNDAENEAERERWWGRRRDYKELRKGRLQDWEGMDRAWEESKEEERGENILTNP